MIPPRRRGECPSLAVPMATGDGLLARITPAGATIPLAALKGLCEAARRHGNGVIEVTARGGVQVRGLSAASAPRLVEAVAGLGIDATDGVPVIANPLAGLEPGEAIDAVGLAAELRAAIRAAGLNGRLAPKVSVAVDGGGALHLGGLAADLRLRAETSPAGVRLDVSIGGDAAGATRLGAVARGDAPEAIVRLLETLAARGRTARAREVAATEGLGPFRSALADLLGPDEALSPSPQPDLSRLAAAPSSPLPRERGSERSAATRERANAHDAPMCGDFSIARRRAEPIGTHRLRDGTVALGLELAFGHSDAEALERLADAAGEAGASGLRAAPGHALLIIGVSPGRAAALSAAAEGLGFVTKADDPRRAIAACAGAPLCASAALPTRALAPQAAQALAAILDGSLEVHLSGCVKGCAYPAAALLGIIGVADGCGIVVNGKASDEPVVTVPTDALKESLERLARAVARERRKDESARDALVRLGPAGIAAVLKDEPYG